MNFYAISYDTQSEPNKFSWRFRRLYLKKLALVIFFYQWLHQSLPAISFEIILQIFYQWSEFLLTNSLLFFSTFHIFLIFQIYFAICSEVPFTILYLPSWKYKCSRFYLSDSNNDITKVYTENILILSPKGFPCFSRVSKD